MTQNQRGSDKTGAHRQSEGQKPMGEKGREQSQGGPGQSDSKKSSEQSRHQDQSGQRSREQK